MKIILGFLVWCVLLVIAWPLALLVLVLAPVIWILSIPFQLLYWTVAATLSLVRAILFLPARLLGGRT